MRDVRDPEALGEALRRLRARYPNRRLSELREIIERDEIPSYDRDPTTLARYGDPRLRHEQRLADGTEPTVT